MNVPIVYVVSYYYIRKRKSSFISYIISLPLSSVAAESKAKSC